MLVVGPMLLFLFVFCIFCLGVLLILLGSIFLIVFLIKRRKNKRNKTKKGLSFLVAAIVLLLVGLMGTAPLPGLLAVFQVIHNQTVDKSINPAQYPVNNALEKNSYSQLKRRLRNDANPNEVHDGCPALFNACSGLSTNLNTNYRSAKLLIDYGADIHVKVDGQTALYYMIDRCDGVNHMKDVLRITQLLLDSGLDVDEKDENGISLPMRAVSHSNFDHSKSIARLVSLLISYGADVNAADAEGRTVLMWACATQTLNPNSAYPVGGARIDQKKDFAPFEYEIISTLIEHGADLHAQDNQGYTALDYFRQAMEDSRQHAMGDEWDREKTFETPEYQEECAKIEALLSAD